MNFTTERARYVQGLCIEADRGKLWRCTSTPRRNAATSPLIKKSCSEGVCSTHDGPPLDAAEEDAFEDGDDPCIVCVRLYPPMR